MEFLTFISTFNDPHIKDETFLNGSVVTVLNANPYIISHNGNTTDNIESCDPVNFFVSSNL
ncbi:hypothetical protein MHBO_004661 [Bonamia ostreae]|uniref:Uncharacterized protein n=1 Tax=Bonamia ostreae TaxID=126728 RepID=A0ABV2ATY6_9EUKA